MLRFPKVTTQLPVPYQQFLPCPALPPSRPLLKQDRHEQPPTTRRWSGVINRCNAFFLCAFLTAAPASDSTQQTTRRSPTGTFAWTFAWHKRPLSAAVYWGAASGGLNSKLTAHVYENHFKFEVCGETKGTPTQKKTVQKPLKKLPSSSSIYTASKIYFGSEGGSTLQYLGRLLWGQNFVVRTLIWWSSEK